MENMKLQKFSLTKTDLNLLRQHTYAGIYSIKNLFNNKQYIGSSLDLNRRIKKHLNDLRKKKHDNEYLQRSFNKYGESQFEIYIIEQCEESELTELENTWMKHYKSTNRKYGFNLAEDPRHPGRLCKEAREKISKAKSGKNHHFWGKELSKEHKIKVSDSLIGNKRALGMKHSEETLQKMSDKAKKKWQSMSDKEREEFKENRAKALRLVKIKSHKPTDKNPYPGVYLNKNGKSYFSQICIKRKIKRLGTFINKEEAKAAYEKALVDYELV